MEPSVPMSSMPVASMPMPFVPMPATVGVPRHRADQEQHGDHDEYFYPRLPSSHGLTSVLTLLFPCDTPPDASLYCTHDLPRVTTLKAQEKNDWISKLGAMALSADRPYGPAVRKLRYDVIVPLKRKRDKLWQLWTYLPHGFSHQPHLTALVSSLF